MKNVPEVKVETKLKCPECKGAGQVHSCQAGNYAGYTCHTCKGEGECSQADADWYAEYSRISKSLV